MPRIKITPMAKFALYFLRVYLIVLLTLIVVKFVKVFGTGESQAKPTPAASDTRPASRG